MSALAIEKAPPKKAPVRVKKVPKATVSIPNVPRVPKGPKVVVEPTNKELELESDSGKEGGGV
jgi:hypothetical protein